MSVGVDGGPPSIVLTDVVKTYPRTTALSRVTAAIRPGITALLGPNGAGKTTLLRCLATVLEPEGGRIEIRGINATQRSNVRAVRRMLGYVPQNPQLYPSVTVRQFLDHIAILREISERDARRAEVEHVATITDLTAQLDKKVRTLSGGTRQRVALAQALLGAPPVLLLDEPTVGLDPGQRNAFRSVLGELRSPAMTIILSTHLTDDVSDLCDHVLVLDKGVILFSGTPAQLTARADGAVWLADTPSAGALASWRTGAGRYRSIGGTPPGAASELQPTIEDGYLVLVGDAGRVE